MIYEVTIDRRDPDGGPGEVIARRLFEDYDAAHEFYSSLLSMQYFYMYDSPGIRPASGDFAKGRDF